MVEFSALAAGCVLYLTSPDMVCAAVSQGRWGQEVEHFLHGIASGHSHGHHHEEEEEEAEVGEPCHGLEYLQVGLPGLEKVLRELLKHYESSDVEVSGGAKKKGNVGRPSSRNMCGFE